MEIKRDFVIYAEPVDIIRFFGNGYEWRYLQKLALKNIGGTKTTLKTKTSLRSLELCHIQFIQQDPTNIAKEEVIRPFLRFLGHGLWQNSVCLANSFSHGPYRMEFPDTYRTHDLMYDIGCYITHRHSQFPKELETREWTREVGGAGKLQQVTWSN